MTMLYPPGVVRPAPRPEAARVLVCFAYCGGGTATFRPWAQHLPEDVDLALVCLPGRERRALEAPATSWSALMTEALTAVRSVADRPYVLFGHSMGAWVAFEATVHMQRSGAPPQALIVSASRAPHRAPMLRDRPPTSTTPDDELLDWMCDVGQLPKLILDDPGLRRMAIDLFRADKRAAESYEYGGGRVACPLRRLCGDADPDIRADDDDWSTLAAGPYDSRTLPGGHFYTEAEWSALPRHFDL